jgi:hypothetical protein
MINKIFKKDYKKITIYFKANKKRIIKNFIYFLSCFFLAIFFVGTKIFYPFHFVIAIIFLLVSLWFIVKSLYVSRSDFASLETYLEVKKILKKRKVLVVLIILFIFLVVIYNKYSQGLGNPFIKMNSQEISAFVENDLSKSTVLLDSIEITGGKLLDSNLLTKNNLTLDEREELMSLWSEFLFVLIESEKITETHKYFNNISYLLNQENHTKSFVIAYSLYLKKYELFYKIISKVAGNMYITKILNEDNKIFGNKNSYDKMVSHFFYSDLVLKRSLGGLYLVFLGHNNRDIGYGENYLLLKKQAMQSNKYLFNNFNKSLLSVAKIARVNIERSLFDLWFPIQKNSASLMGNLYLSSRNSKLITVDQIQEMKKFMQTGDIVIERKNWFVSNLGIPGFWPHSALYLGEITEADQYFSEVFPYAGYENFSKLVEIKYPEIYKKYITKDEKGFAYAVIEGRAPGIILQSLEKSADVDYVGVMRPRLAKLDKLKAILRAFDNYDKPYDYNFDFETRDEFVCSELIYDAYLPANNKKGLHLDLKQISGRKIFSPTDFVAKLKTEKYKENRELDFIYFINGNEKLGKAFVESETVFLETLQKPKYDWGLE